MATSQRNTQEHERVLNSNRTFIINKLNPEDVIDELIEEKILGKFASQRVQLNITRTEKNRIIVDQLLNAEPSALRKFIAILKVNKSQAFIANKLEKCELLLTEMHSYVCYFCAGINSRTSVSQCQPIVSSGIDVNMISRLKAQYDSYLTRDWPHYYVQLALVKQEMVTRGDKDLNEITKLTLSGQVDELRSKKIRICGLKEIFRYMDQPCPRLILIIGGPGKQYYNTHT